MTATNVLVRVQAKGGKFIGPDAGYSQVTLTDVSSGKVLAQGTAEGGSGTLTGTFTPAATRQAIVTPGTGGDTLQWLAATAGQPTAGFTAALELDADTLVRFSAEALTNGEPNGHVVTQTMWLSPGADLIAEPGVVLVMPGLIVSDVKWAQHTDPLTVEVTAWVSMMCGCKIDPSLPWHPDEFTVTATLTDDDSGAVVAQVPLAFQSTSTFGTAQPVPLSQGGAFVLTVTAVQAAEGNVGSASVPMGVFGAAS